MRPIKILIFIEVDVVVRHFVHSRIFDDLAKNAEVTFVFPEQGHKRMKGLDPAKLDLPSSYLHLPVHNERQKWWKWLYLLRQIRRFPGEQAAALRRLHLNAVGPKAAFIFTILSLPGLYHVSRWALLFKLRQHSNEGLSKLLNEFRPDVVIHPCVLEGSYINDLLEALQLRGIPSVVIMNSWDNPSTKRAMVGKPDWMLVWGEQTKRHAIDLAGMPADRVLSFGVAQFETYRTLPRIDHAEFLRCNGLPADRPIVMYAGSSKGTDEIAHLTLLDRAIESGALPRVTILYRPHPWGNGGKGGERLLDQPWCNVVIENSMRGYLERVRAGDRNKYLSDYCDTHDVLSHIDALMSPLSTIILEAAMHRKPVMCFMPESDGSEHFMLDAALMHFHDMFRMPQMLLAYSNAELILRTNELISRIGDEVWIQALAENCSFFVQCHKRPYGERLTAFIAEVARTQSPTREDGL